MNTDLIRKNLCLSVYKMNCRTVRQVSFPILPEIAAQPC
jgi:hypothetical protein